MQKFADIGAFIAVQLSLFGQCCTGIGLVDQLQRKRRQQAHAGLLLVVLCKDWSGCMY